jgi:hypothetical protein
MHANSESRVLLCTRQTKIKFRYLQNFEIEEDWCQLVENVPALKKLVRP